MAIGLLSLLVGTHFGLPYISIIAPDPWITGYIGYYAGLISFVIIPFILLILLASKMIWKHQRLYTYRYPMAGIWIVTTVIFLGTALFTASNFSYGTSVSKKISEAHLGEDGSVQIDISRIKNTEDMDIHLGHSRLSRGMLYKNGVKLNFGVADDDKMTVTQTAYSRGTNYRSAVGHMAAPDHKIAVEGHNISLDEYYTIPRNRKYRAQKLEYEVALPLGTTVTFNRGSKVYTKWELRRVNYDSDQGWVMTEQGLELQETEEGSI